MGKLKDMEIKMQDGCCGGGCHEESLQVMTVTDIATYHLDALAKEVFQNNKAKGFWDAAKTATMYVDDTGQTVSEPDFVPELRNTGELLMLMVSELAEAMEAFRKDKMDDHLPQYKGVYVEVADALIRILDYAGAHEIPLGEIVRAKLEYNKTRPYKHGKKL